MANHPLCPSCGLWLENCKGHKPDATEEAMRKFLAERAAREKKGK